jgi:hypothetical protein
MHNDSFMDSITINEAQLNHVTQADPTMPGPKIKIKIKYETDVCVQYSTCV